MINENEEEQQLFQQKLAEFNEYLHKCRALFNSDPTRVSHLQQVNYSALQTRTKIKFRNESGLIVLKVTNERTTHRFQITKDFEDMGPRLIGDFNKLMLQVTSNAKEKRSQQEQQRPQTGGGGGGGKKKNQKNKKK